MTCEPKKTTALSAGRPQSSASAKFAGAAASSVSLAVATDATEMAKRKAKKAAAKKAADPFGVLKSVAVYMSAVGAAGRPAATTGSGQAESNQSSASAPVGYLSIADLLAASMTWASSDVGSAGYSSLAESLAQIRDRTDKNTASEASENAEEQCPKCGEKMHMLEHEYQCSSCRFVVEGDTTLADPADDDALARRQPQTGRLRIVGPNSGHYQPDLDRSSSTNYAATQRKQVYEEYLALRQRSIETGGRAFPLNVLELATDYYHAIQRLVTKRSHSKKVIMASCLQMACLEKKFAPSKSEIAKFMGLVTKGTARGENFIRGLCADGLIDVDVNKDTCGPHIETTFALLGLDTPDHAHLKAVVERVVKLSIADAIGISSIVRSKVMGATYSVLRRSATTTSTKAIPLSEFCQKCSIRKNTVMRFIDEMEAYHSHFEQVFKDAGIFSGVVHLS